MESRHNADKSFEGYDFQVLRVVTRLLEGIERNECIYSAIELKEDVWEHNNGVNIYEQDKLYTSKNFTFNSEEIKKSIGIFLDNWIDVQYSSNVKFVFYTNTSYGKERNNKITEFPEKEMFYYLTEGENIERHWKIIKESAIKVVKRYYLEKFRTSQDKRENVKKWKEDDWKKFFKAVEWHFEGMDSSQIRKVLKNKIDKLCGKYTVNASLADFILAKIERDIADGVCKKTFIDRIVSTDKIENYFLKLSNYKLQKEFALDNAWFEMSMNKSLTLLKGVFSRERYMELYDDSFLEKLSDISSESAQKPYYLICGKAGIGKTSFLAHCSEKYHKNYGKAVLVLGQRCIGSQMLDRKILDYLDVDKQVNINGFLQRLDSWGEILQKRSVIFLDAVNQSGAEEEDILYFLESIKQYKHIGLVIGVRQDLEEQHKFLDSEFEQTHLKGFQRIEEVENFLIHYDIPMGFHYQTYLFKQPLLLVRNFCECYKEGKYSPEEPLYKIFDYNFEMVNNKILKGKERIRANVVRIALDVYCDIILQQKDMSVEYDEFVQRCEGVLGKYHLHFNVVDTLCDENIFSFYYNKQQGKGYVFIEFELWQEYLIVKRILEKCRVAEFSSSDQLRKFLSRQNEYYSLLSDYKVMLAILLPDIKCPYEEGGYEVFFWEEEGIYDSKYLFLNSLYWRKLDEIPRVAYSVYINDFYVQMRGYDILYDMWECVLTQCMRGNGNFGIQFLLGESERCSNSVVQQVWASYLNQEFYESVEYRNINYTMQRQQDNLDEVQICNMMYLYTYFLYSLNKNIISDAKFILAELFKRNVEKVYDFLCQLAVCCKDSQVYLYLLQVLYNIADRFPKKELENIYTFFGSITWFVTEEIMVEDYYWYQVFLRGIGEFLNIKTNSQDIIPAKEFITLTEDGLKQIYDRYHREHNDIRDEGMWRLEGTEEEEKESYYICQNRLVEKFLGNQDEYQEYDFTSDYLLESIDLMYRKSFLHNVFLNMMEEGYAYARFGFKDMYKREGTYAKKYEKLALNTTMLSYLKKTGKKMDAFYEYLNNFFLTDCSIPANLRDIQYKQWTIDESRHRLRKSVESKAEWIPLTSGCCTEAFEMDIYSEDKDALKWNGTLEKKPVELLFYNEIYRTKRFEAIMSDFPKDRVCFQYLWDYTPFFLVQMLNLSFMKEYGLNYNHDKLTYSRNNEILCKNILIEEQVDQLVVNRRLLEEISKNNRIRWSWVSNGEYVEIIFCG